MLRKEQGQTERADTPSPARARAQKAGPAAKTDESPDAEGQALRELEQQLIARWGPPPHRSNDASTARPAAALGDDHADRPAEGPQDSDKQGRPRPSSAPARPLPSPARRLAASIGRSVAEGWYDNRSWRDGAFVLVAILVGLGGWWAVRDAPDSGNRSVAGAPAVMSPAVTEELARSTQALEQERNKVEALAQELASAWREIGAHSVTLADKAALETEVTSLQNELRQAVEQKSLLDAALATGRVRDKQVTSLQNDLRKATEQRSALEAALGDARARNIEAASLQGELRKATEQKSVLEAALAEARARNNEVSSLQSELRKASEQKSALEAALAEARARNDEAASLQSELRKAGEQKSMLETALAEARARNNALVEQVAAQLPAPASLARTSAENVAPSPVQAPSIEARGTTMASVGPPVALAAAPAAEAPAAATTPMPSGDGSTAERLMVRATLLLRQGDIGGARSVLERAVELGEVAALLALAESYDPAFLAAIGAVGTQGDVARARALYTRALAAGATEAKARVDALP